MTNRIPFTVKTSDDGSSELARDRVICSDAEDE
jgi:hypothetical protein